MIPEYLISFSTGSLPCEETGCLVVGAGVAGLRACLELKDCGVLLVCKDFLGDSGSYHAQGGIAAALADSDSPGLHYKDTLEAGVFLNDPASVKILVEEGPARVKELIAWGVSFDRNEREGGYDFTREAAHSVSRILHSHGDATGRELVRVLAAKVRDNPDVKLAEGFFLVDLLSCGGEIRGALLYNRKKRKLVCLKAKKILLASGGAGQIYQETTNPFPLTGDAQAAVFRKGGVLSDLEFVQFHPTTLYLAGAPRFLISESVRGEGAVLLDKNRRQFMAAYHPLKELAPRDVVSRAIVKQMKKTSASCVYLDLSKMSGSFIKKRFPEIYRTCLGYGLDVTKDLVPVRPAAHYLMGGIKTDLNGRTSLANLFACGEAAEAGVHGANRLASNSLLEGIVFGARAGTALREEIGRTLTGRLPEISFSVKKRKNQKPVIDSEDLRRSIKSLMWKNAGIERQETALAEALQKIAGWAGYVYYREFDYPGGWEVQNMLTLGALMVFAARQRKESRGAHFRTDYPEQDDANWAGHQLLSRRELQQRVDTPF